MGAAQLKHQGTPPHLPSIHISLTVRCEGVQSTWCEGCSQHDVKDAVNGNAPGCPAVLAIQCLCNAHNQSTTVNPGTQGILLGHNGHVGWGQNPLAMQC